MKGALQLLAVSAAAALGGVQAFIPLVPSSTHAPAAVAGAKGECIQGTRLDRRGARMLPIHYIKAEL